MSVLSMKLGLGTVQFGMNYGISNTSGKTTNSEVHQILDYAWSAGIDTLDTARDYGVSEEVIGQHRNKSFNIITKFPARSSTKELLVKSLIASLEALQAENVYGYMAHSADCVLEDPQLWEVLNELKEKRKILKAGCSLYTPSQLEKLLAAGIIPDLVQIPYSFLDRRFQPYLAELDALGVEVHARSIFLQGIYFMEPSSMNQFFDSIKPVLSDLKSLQMSKEELAAQLLGFVADEPAIDKLIFGVNTLSQLKENIDGFSSYEYSKLFIDVPVEIPDQILIPSYWPK